jgi:hypothetical protein
MRAYATAALLLSLGTCHPPARASGSLPAPRDTTQRLVAMRSDSAVDSALAGQLRRAREQAYRSAERVDTILVHPDTLKLKVDQFIPLFGGPVTVDPRTTDGRHVDHFAPLYEVGDQSIAGFSGPGIEGRRPGLTWLIISAFSGPEGERKIIARSMMWILVEP